MEGSRSRNQDLMSGGEKTGKTSKSAKSIAFSQKDARSNISSKTKKTDDQRTEL